MAIKTKYLTLEQIQLIHTDQINNYGGTHGVRDEAALESAISRPQSSFDSNELYPTIFEKAAALTHSIINNHPFLDGNKRIGMVSGIIFLAQNHHFLEVEQEELVEVAIKIATNQWNLKEISTWLKQNSKSI